MSSHRRRLAVCPDSAGSPEIFAAPSVFSPLLRGRGPPILPLYHPLLPVQGRFSGELTGYIGGLSDRLWGALSTACHGRAPGAPPPGRGCASLRNAPLDAAVSQIHRRGLGAPGPAQGCPLWHHAPRWTRRTWAIHPAALSRLLRGVASRDQPQERPRYHSVPRRWTRLEFLGLVTAHSRVPRQRSSPTREASLGLCLPSALSGDRAVGLSVARHLVWGRGCRARSRRIWRST